MIHSPQLQGNTYVPHMEVSEGSGWRHLQKEQQLILVEVYIYTFVCVPFGGALCNPLCTGAGNANLTQMVMC